MAIVFEGVEKLTEQNRNHIPEMQYPTAESTGLCTNAAKPLFSYLVTNSLL
jgi:hypothetical protein